MSATRQTGSIGVRLAGTGMAVPPRMLTNADLTKIVDTTDEWITQRTGIKTRHIVDPGMGVRTLAVEAVGNALKNANIPASKLDMLICATTTPEMPFPATGVRVVAELGAAPAGAMDISVACSGFVYGLNFAAGLIRSGQARTVAVVGSETLTKITNWKDRQTCVLFGDGAGAAILTADSDPQRGNLHSVMGSDGTNWKHLYCPRNQEDIPSDDSIFTGQFNTLQMNGREVFKFAVTTIQRSIDQVLSEAGVQPSQLAMVIPHQSNLRIIESARERMGLPPEKMHVNIDRYGNTSAASVGICLHEVVSAGKVKQGDLVMFIALGGGFTWTASLWKL